MESFAPSERKIFGERIERVATGVVVARWRVRIPLFIVDRAIGVGLAARPGGRFLRGRWNGGAHPMSERILVAVHRCSSLRR